MSTFLITGGAGFIGSHLADRLLLDGSNRIVVLDNFHEYYDRQIKLSNIRAHANNPRYELIEASITDPEALLSVFATSEIDAVIHLAARTGVRPSLAQALEYEHTNVRGTVEILEMARAFKIPKFIFGSSSSVYGTGAASPFREDALTFPITPYAASKASGEMYVHAYSHLYGIQALCLRFFTVFGPRQRPDLAIHKFAKLMTSGRPIPLYGDGTTARDYTYVTDIVDGIVAALVYTASPFEIINLGGSQTTELRELVELLEAEMSLKATVQWLPVHPGDLLKTHADIDRARQLLGWQPKTDLRTGIRAFLEWFRLS